MEVIETINMVAIRKEAAEMEKEIALFMQKRTDERHWTKADLVRILVARKLGGDYSMVHQSTLYKKHSGEYCRLLEAIALWYGDN